MTQPITIPRRALQALFFLLTGQWLLMGFLRCPFGVPFVCCSFCPLGDCTGTFLQVPFIGLLLVSIVLLGRVFCGWVCPVGFLQDAAAKLPKVRVEPSPRLRVVEAWSRGVKYLALLATVWLVFRFNFPPERAHPYVVRSSSVFNWESVSVAVQLGATRYPIRAVMLIIALASGLVVSRFWCRYLCPLGAGLGLLSRLSVFAVTRDEATCADCGEYPRSCVQHTTPGSAECIACGDCVQGCPHGAVHVSRRRGKR